MRKDIKVYSDNLLIKISAVGDKKYFVEFGDFSAIELSEDELEELKCMIDEIIQLSNKRDW